VLVGAMGVHVRVCLGVGVGVVLAVPCVPFHEHPPPCDYWHRFSSSHPPPIVPFRVWDFDTSSEKHSSENDT
jgi:hypothetical protein